MRANRRKVIPVNFLNGSLVRYAKLRVAHGPGIPGFSPPPQVSDHDMHHGMCVTHVPWCMPGLLASGFLWSRWRGKRSRHSRRMRNPPFYVSGKSPMAVDVKGFYLITHMTSESCSQLNEQYKHNFQNRLKVLMKARRGTEFISHKLTKYQHL